LNREAQVQALLLADADNLMTILTGGIYLNSLVGVEGIRRGESSPTSAAFDERGVLLPCALLREDWLVPYGTVRSPKDKYTMTSQRLSIFLYQFRGDDQIDLAKFRIYQLLENERLQSPGSYPLVWLVESGHVPDIGPVQFCTTLMQDWQIISSLRGT
jgi:hypothetical protein